MSIHEDPLCDEEIDGIRESLQDVEAGRLFIHDEVKKALGLS